LKKDLEKEVDSAVKGVGLNGSFDPMEQARKQIADTVEGPKKLADAPPAASKEEPGA
jgi:hypothetical protein